MLTNPSSGRRLTGRMMVLATVAVALPLTATRAIDYVDVPTPETLAPAAPIAAAAPVAAPAPVAPVAPVAAVAPVAPAVSVRPARELRFDDEGTININGKTKRWKDLTPAEKAEVRRAIAHARQEIARTRIDREQIRRDVREAMSHARVDKEELRRDLAEARAEIERAMRDVDGHVVDIRRSGRNPEEIRATIRASLKAVEAIDVEKITRQAMASVDHEAIEASIAAAEASVERAQDEIDHIEDRLGDADDDE